MSEALEGVMRVMGWPVNEYRSVIRWPNGDIAFKTDQNFPTVEDLKRKLNDIHTQLERAAVPRELWPELVRQSRPSPEWMDVNE